MRGLLPLVLVGKWFGFLFVLYRVFLSLEKVGPLVSPGTLKFSYFFQDLFPLEHIW